MQKVLCPVNRGCSCFLGQKKSEWAVLNYSSTDTDLGFQMFSEVYR